MRELREMAEAVVEEGRKAGLCPSPIGCEYCDYFGCPRDPRPVQVVESPEGVHIIFNTAPWNFLTL